MYARFNFSSGRVISHIDNIAASANTVNKFTCTSTDFAEILEDGGWFLVSNFESKLRSVVEMAIEMRSVLPVDICSTENALISVDQLEGLTWLHFGDMLHMDFVSGRSTAECSSPKSELSWPDIDEEDEGDIYDVDEEDDDEEDDEMLIIGSLLTPTSPPASVTSSSINVSPIEMPSAAAASDSSNPQLAKQSKDLKAKREEFAVDIREQVTMAFVRNDIGFLLSGLTLNERAEAQVVWDKLNRKELVSVARESSLPGLDSLPRGKKCNDTAINEVAEMLNDYAATSERPVPVIVGNSFLFEYLQRGETQTAKLQNWFREHVPNDNRQRILMMPVNVRGNHWICAIFERGRTKNTHGWFDPLDACATHEDILKVASDLLCHSDGGSKPASSLQYYRGPMQANGTDCGFCVIGFILGEFGRLVMVEPRSDALKHLLPTKISPALDSNYLSRSLECASQVQNFPLQLQQKRIRDIISSMIYTECIESAEMYSMVSALVEPQLPEENPATPYLNNIDRYCQLLEAGQWGDSPEFVAMSKWLHCPVVVVEFPSGNKGVSRTHIFGEDEPGIEVFFLRLNGNHYAVLVPVSDRYELFAEKARSEVYVEPIQKAFIIRGVSVLMLVFGTPMDGNCFFHGAALIEVCVAYAKLVRPPTLHFSRYVKLSKEQRQTVSAANKQFDRCAKVQRQLASTEGGQHSFDELTTGSVLKRHVARDYFGVGPQEGSVIMDPGIGTGTELFHANLYKTNAWIAIGFEENLHLSHGADRTHLNLLRENWRGMMAHAHINSNDVSSFVGVTNVTSYDGAPWSVTTPIDTPHLQLILMFMETDTIDEFTSTKLT